MSTDAARVRIAGLLVVCAGMLGQTSFAEVRPRAERTPWTTSHVSGTPDPAPPYKVEPVFTKITFDRPVLLDFIPGTSRLVVGEVGGKVRSFPNRIDADRAETAIDLPTVRPGSSVLYGLAFHPRFETNRYVYLCYVAKGDDPNGTRVSRFKASDVDPLILDPASEEVVLSFLSGGHNAGCLAFGPDGYLYISTGDTAAPTPPDPLTTGQDVSDLLSSILRVNINERDPGKTYRIPPDNPFIKLPGARGEVWAYGLRNPWRMSFDRVRGDLWVGDVGWELWEMIHLVRSGSNCGWSLVEGTQPVRVDAKRGPTPIVPPVIAHPHSEAASITGGYVYRGQKFKALQGVYIYGDYQSGKVWGLRYDGQNVTWRGELADTGLRLVSFGEDREGELYLIEYERTNGIYRLVPDSNAGARPAFPRLISETGLFASTKDLTPALGVVLYQVNAELWADGANAVRMMAVPGRGHAEIDPEGRWSLPDGSVLARTVTLDLIEGNPGSRRRLETQILHREIGNWRPYTYVWNETQTDATLAEAAGSTQTFHVRDSSAPGGRREHVYRIAARSECILCHNPWVGSSGNVTYGRQSASPLALTTAQLNHGGQLAQLGAMGLLARPITNLVIPRLADPRDQKAPIEARARAYLEVNCAHCHQNGAGGSANIVLTSRTSLAETNTLNAVPAQGRFGLDDARIIAPGEPERSVLFYRIAKTGSGRMPRIGSDRVDPVATRVLGEWIAAMPHSAVKSASKADLHNQLESPSASLRLVRRIDFGQVPAAERGEIISAARLARTEVRDLFERFLPDADRVKRLGDTIDLSLLLARSGDARRGRDLFRAEGGLTCRTCHKAEGSGGDVGPALDGLGSKYSPSELLGQVLDPSKVVEPKYATTVVATKSGKVIAGLLIEENAAAIVIREANGQSTRVSLADIEDRRREPKSLMPEGLLRDLTPQQAADLLAYLHSLKR